MTVRRRALIGAGALGAAVALVLTQDLASPSGVERAIEDASPLAPVLFVGVYAVLTVTLVPGAVGSTAAGALFGAVWGTVLTVTGATLGATVAFLFSRGIGRSFVERRAGRRLTRIDRWLTGGGFGAVLFLRLVPLFPFNVVNYGAGLSGLPLRTFVAGTAIGILPGAAAWVGLGAGLDDPGSPTFIASLALLGTLSAAGLIALRVTRARRGPRGELVP
jgi:uncharacterized membrane protein YdjX (TVP38/TMEM64 family)